MSDPIRVGEPIPAALEADYQDCLSCNGCRSVCTMHIASNRLPPLRLLRIAALGLQDNLLELPDIWYCLQCHQCSKACPMTVKPSVLVHHARREAVRRGIVDQALWSAWESLHEAMLRARWHIIDKRARGAELVNMAAEWRRWAETAIESPREVIALGPSSSGAQDTLANQLGFPVDLTACMTCGACTSTCPVSRDPAVFDPVAIFRLANLGQLDELLHLPTIWMCLQCERCTQVCTQLVSGHLVLSALQDLAMARGHWPKDTRDWLWEIDQSLYPRFIAAIDELFAGSGLAASSEIP